MRHTPARLFRSRLDGRRRAAAAFPVARSFYGSVPSGYFALSLSLFLCAAWRGVAWLSVPLLITKVAKKAECIIRAALG